MLNRYYNRMLDLRVIFVNIGYYNRLFLIEVGGSNGEALCQKLKHIRALVRDSLAPLSKTQGQGLWYLNLNSSEFDH
jgi:hypothetical protein